MSLGTRHASERRSGRRPDLRASEASRGRGALIMDPIEVLAKALRRRETYTGAMREASLCSGRGPAYRRTTPAPGEDGNYVNLIPMLHD